jgi:hypothetical protein
MALYRRGVAAKAMASHALNATSSRSHVLFTLYVDSNAPAPAPATWGGMATASGGGGKGGLSERSARLTLVDLAGSERGERIGATSGGRPDYRAALGAGAGKQW